MKILRIFMLRRNRDEEFGICGVIVMKSILKDRMHVFKFGLLTFQIHHSPFRGEIEEFRDLRVSLYRRNFFFKK